MSRIRNDLAFFHIETQTTTGKPSTTSRVTTDQRSVIVRKTDVNTNTSGPPDKMCPIHLSDHSLNHCREFSRWDMKRRKDLLKKKGICFKCCASNNHLMKNCKQPIQCEKCDSELHPTALHVTESNNRRTPFSSSETANNYGGGEQRYPLNALHSVALLMVDVPVPRLFLRRYFLLIVHKMR